MHTVIETPKFLSDCRGMTEEARLAIVTAYAADPQQGNLMPNTGGARKAWFAGRGKGQSGGYRVVSYYAAADVPVFLLALINKGDGANLSKAEQNALREKLSRIAETYRAGVKRRIRRLPREERPWAN
jgi:hypothetical protein